MFRWWSVLWSKDLKKPKWRKGEIVKKLIILAVMIVCASQAAAELKATVGSGNLSCGTHNAGNDIQKGMDLQWVLGYLVSENFRLKFDILVGTDLDAIAGALNLYCQKNPLDKVAQAGASVYFQLIERAKK